jgi:hypothetical protein
MYRNVPGGSKISSLAVRGYLPRAEPLATQYIVLYGVNGMKGIQKILIMPSFGGEVK